MTTRFRITTVAGAAAALSVTATLVAGPAHADGPGFSFERNTATEREAPAESAAADEAVEVLRIGGKNRIETAIIASQMAWVEAGAPDGPVAEAVVLGRADDYADALGGAALAGAASAPLLLTPSASLDARVQAEIVRLLGEGTEDRRGVVYLLGGTGALSADLEAQVEGLGYTAIRAAGPDRYATSVAVAKAVEGFLPPAGIPQFVMATTGQDFPDGLAAGATAGGFGATVVLTKGSTVPTVVANYLKDAKSNSVPLFAVGGQAAAATAVAWDGKLAGKDRFQTAAQVADLFWGTDPESTPVAIGLATGLDWPDALAGGAFMAGYGPLMLTKPTVLPAPTSAITSSLVGLTSPSSVQGGAVFGGAQTVTDEVMTEFGALLKG